MLCLRFLFFFFFIGTNHVENEPDRKPTANSDRHKRSYVQKKPPSVNRISRRTEFLAKIGRVIISHPPTHPIIEIPSPPRKEIFREYVTGPDSNQNIPRYYHTGDNNSNYPTNTGFGKPEEIINKIAIAICIVFATLWVFFAICYFWCGGSEEKTQKIKQNKYLSI